MTTLNRSIAEAAVRGAAAEEAAVLVLRALSAGHPTLVYLRPQGGGPHRLTWMEDDGPHTEPRDTAVQLAAYARARFGQPAPGSRR